MSADKILELRGQTALACVLLEYAELACMQCTVADSIVSKQTAFAEAAGYIRHELWNNIQTLEEV